MDHIRQRIGAGGIATVGWIIFGLYLYLSSAGASLFSWSALGFFAAGTVAVALVSVYASHGATRGFAQFLMLVRPPRRRGDRRRAATVITVFNAAFMVANVVLVVVAADWVFNYIESPSLPAEYVADRDNFGVAMKSFYDARELDQKMTASRSTDKIDPATEAKIQELIKTGLTHGVRVRQEFLAYLDPELPQHFESQLMRGHELVVEGRQTTNVPMQEIGNGLLENFYKTFMPAHQNMILKQIAR